MVVLKRLKKKIALCLASIFVLSMGLNTSIVKAENQMATVEISTEGKGSVKIIAGQNEYATEDGVLSQDFPVGTDLTISLEPEDEQKISEVVVNESASDTISETFSYSLTEEGLKIKVTFAAEDVQVSDSEESIALMSDYEVMAAATTGTITYHSPSALKDSHGTRFSKYRVDGIWSWCIEAKKTTPLTNMSVTITESSNENLRKVLWYGCKGPGAILSDNNDGWMQTAQAASIAYCGVTVNNTNYRGWYNTVIQKAAPPSTFKVYVAKPSNSSYQALGYFVYTPSTKGTLKICKRSYPRVNSEVSSYFSYEGAVYGVYSDKACTNKLATLTAESDGYSNGVLLDAGTYYVQEISPPPGHIISGEIYTAVARAGTTVNVGVTDQPYGLVQITKKSANPDLTDNNDCYSLEGVEYTIYSDAACTKSVTTLKTDANGQTEVKHIIKGTYYAKETKAPYGFKLSDEVQELAVIAGDITKAEFENEPLVKEFDPYAILLGKIDAETNINKPQGSASLGGAHFEIKFFEGEYAENVNPEDEGIAPDRTWVFETDADGYCDLSEDYFAEGYNNSDLYYLNGDEFPDLPLGTLVMREIKAPEGYQIYNVPVIRKVEVGGGYIAIYNEPIIPETPLKITITKKLAGSEIVIPNTEVTHVKPDGTIEVLTTDANGVVAFYGLEQGTHMVYESKAASGYKFNEKNKIEFSISDKNEFSFINTESLDSSIKYAVGSDRNGEVTFVNELLPFSLQIHKLNNKGALLDGAEFTLYSDESLFQVIEVGTTKDGILTFRNLVPGKTYYFKETKAPDGYTLPEEVNVCKLYVESNPVDGVFDFYINDTKYTVEHTDVENDIYLSGAVDDRVINIKVVNTIGLLLPATGSSANVIMIFFGMMSMLASAMIYKKKLFKENK